MELKKLKVSGKGSELGVHQSGFLAPLLPQSKLCTKTQLPTSAWVQLYSCVDGCGHSYTQTSPILCLGHHCEFTVGKLIKHRVVRYSLGYSRVYGLPKRLSGKKNPPAMRETWVPSLGREDHLEEEMATHSSILAWRNPMDSRAWQATSSSQGHKSLIQLSS